MKTTYLQQLKSRAEKILLAKNVTMNPNKVSDVKQLLEELTLHQIELEAQNEDLLKSQAVLEEARNKYMQLYEMAPLGYFTLNEKGLIVEVNHSGEELLGLVKSSLLNRCFSRYIHVESQAVFSQHYKHILENHSQHSCELKFLRWNGSIFHASVISKAIINKASEQTQVLVFIEDITHQKQREEYVNSQRVKLAAIDRIGALLELASYIAFEQRNALTIVDNYIHGCIRRIENKKLNPDELLYSLRTASKHSNQLISLVNHIKNSTSKKIFRYESTPINTIIDEAIMLIKCEVQGYPVAIYFDKGNYTTRVKLDKIHIQQVIVNLARNAIEAMKDANVSEPQIIIETGLVENTMINISIRDNGPGFHPSHTTKLFDPHFTTKSYAVGLGLTQSRSIIEKHGGFLTVELNAYGGVCSKIRLPCVTPI